MGVITKVATPLPVVTDPIAEEIKILHSEILTASRATVEKGLRIGELLIQKRGDPKTRWGFEKWVESNCDFDIRMGQYYMAAFRNAKELRLNPDDWTLTELAQGKRYEPEPELEIKVATTEHPIVVSDTRNNPTPSKRPPCPGVEGIGPGLWKWSEGIEEWIQQAPYKEESKPKTRPTAAEASDGYLKDRYDTWKEELALYFAPRPDESTDIQSVAQAMRCIGVTFGCSWEAVEAAAKTLIHRAHPDKGGHSDRYDNLVKSLNILRSKREQFFIGCN